jgi:phosphoribosyl 1,2-cyclic phosphodiesterase
MLMISLQSGSSGNCIYVESGEVRLLFDAGITGAQAEARLAAYGRGVQGLDALFISHDHFDHVRCAGVFTRKFGVPLYATQRTLAVANRRIGLGPTTAVQHFRAGDSVKIKHVTVETVGTPHDAVDGVVFVVDDGVSRLGICTDLGHVFADMHALVGSVDGLFLESNYDVRMLETGYYPESLKRRISGRGGHISNVEAAELVAKSASSRLQWLCLAHLSAKNNTPARALATHRVVLGDAPTIHMTSRQHASQALSLRASTAGALRTPAWQQLELQFDAEPLDGVTRAAHDVVAAVDMQDLAGGRRSEIA